MVEETTILKPTDFDGIDDRDRGFDDQDVEALIPRKPEDQSIRGMHKLRRANFLACPTQAAKTFPIYPAFATNLLQHTHI